MLNALFRKSRALEREDLDIKVDLADDPEWTQQMLDPKLTSPYEHLLAKGVLTAFGRHAPEDKSPQKVKFTYDRVFEYLLQAQEFPGELTVDDVSVIVDRIHHSRGFVSLWGAVRVALQMYLDEHSPEKASVLTNLANMADSRARDGGRCPEGIWRRSARQVQSYLISVPLLSRTENMGRIAVQVGYELALVDVLEQCLLHPSGPVRQLATQAVFYLWQQWPDKGIVVIQRLYDRIAAEWKNLVPSVATNYILGGKRGSDVVAGLGPFLDLIDSLSGMRILRALRFDVSARFFRRS